MEETHNLRRRDLLAAISTTGLALGLPCLARSAQLPGKIIHFGWGTPPPTTIPARIAAMQAIPFDGLVLDPVVNGKPDLTSYRFSWQFWGTKVLPETDYSASISALTGTTMGRFTDNWLRVNVTPGTVDWFDDTAFDAILANAATAGRMTKTCKLKGIFFDTEAYSQKEVWQYAWQPQAAQHTFVEYQEQVRLRGGQFMQALRSGHANTQVILAYGYHLPYRPSSGQVLPLHVSKNGLLPSFIDGMLDAVQVPQFIYDGWEQAYGYRDEDEYSAAYHLIHQKWRAWHHPDVQVKFRQHYRASYGLWLDYRSETTYKPWRTNPAEFSLNYYTPEQFETTLRLALRYTDRYVWIYNNRADWWAGAVPQVYIDTLARAKNL